jgi:hypothetical protein
MSDERTLTRDVPRRLDPTRELTPELREARERQLRAAQEALAAARERAVARIEAIERGFLPLPGVERTSEAFRARVAEIAEDLRMDRNHLMTVMSFESGGTMSPAARNPDSNAVGLIQFTKVACDQLHTTQDALAALSAEEQLDWVQRYLEPQRGRLRTVEDAYMAVLLPNAIGRGDDFIVFHRPDVVRTKDDERAALWYEQNKLLDQDKDGTVTRAEATAPVRDALARARREAEADLRRAEGRVTQCETAVVLLEDVAGQDALDPLRLRSAERLLTDVEPAAGRRAVAPRDEVGVLAREHVDLARVMADTVARSLAPADARAVRERTDALASTVRDRQALERAAAATLPLPAGASFERLAADERDARRELAALQREIRDAIAREQDPVAHPDPALLQLLGKEEALQRTVRDARTGAALLAERMREIVEDEAAATARALAETLARLPPALREAVTKAVGTRLTQAPPRTADVWGREVRP